MYMYTYRCYPHEMHCALVETMGAQTDKQKRTNKPLCVIISSVHKAVKRGTETTGNKLVRTSV